MQKYSLSEVQETRNSKKNRPSWLYEAKNRSNIAIGLKWQKSFKIQIFWLKKNQNVFVVYSVKNLWNYAMLKNNQRKPWGGSKDPKMAKKGPKMTQFRDYQKTRPDTR